MTKVIFPSNERNKTTVSDLLPRLKSDVVDKNLDLLKISSVVDGTKINGSGVVRNHTYRWKMAIESAVKSVAQVPDRFFDVKGRSYPIDWNRKVSVASLPTYQNYKDAIIYRINSCLPVIDPAAKIIFDSNMPYTGSGSYNLICFADAPKITLGALMQDAQTLTTTTSTEVLKLTLTKSENSKLDIVADEHTRILNVTIDNGAERVIGTQDISTSGFSIIPSGPSQSVDISNRVNVQVQAIASGAWKIETISFVVKRTSEGSLETYNVIDIEDSDIYTKTTTTETPDSYSPVTGADGKGFTVYENGLFKLYSGAAAGYIWFYSLIPFDTVLEGKRTNDNRYKFSIELPFYDVPNSIVQNTALIDQFAIYNDSQVKSTLCNYLQNKATTSLYAGNDAVLPDQYGALDNIVDYVNIDEGDYLAIIVDNNDDYHALIGKNTTVNSESNDNRDDFAQDIVIWGKPSIPVDVSQFKGLDMWIRFQGINEMIYFLITKYENDIESISPATIYSTERNSTGEPGGPVRHHTIKVDSEITEVKNNEDLESKKMEGKLWAYVNPRTMTPYADDYWFHQGEPIFVNSLTLVPKDKHIKGNRIIVSADQWPGSYMMVGETYIRDRDTQQDEHLQIKFPLCKVKSDHTLTLSADGDATTFNLNLEIGKPKSGAMMEITTYETTKRLIEGEDGCFYEADGSTEVLSE